MSTHADPEFEALLEQVKASRGSDFTGYKRSTLARRFRKRMDEVRADTYEAYAARLAADPAEFTALFNTILINVTGFFRDPEAWGALTREVLEPLAERKGARAPIRVWTAGCASGEETYTVVMALAEVLGVDAFRERVKVYATDLDDEALAQARQAVYPAHALEAVPEPLRERYFEAARGEFTFRSDLRRLVIFGRNDLARDAPISHLDLLVSRNTLMYFNADVQGRILSRFHFALNDGGVLFLGKAEMLRTRGDLFAPLNLKARLFSRVHRSPPLRDRLLAAYSPRGDGSAPSRVDQRVREALLQAEPWAQVVVAPDGTVLMANQQAMALFSLAVADVGRRLQDLTLSYRPVELRSRVDQVLAERLPVKLDRVDHRAAGGDLRSYEVHLTPLQDGSALLGVAIAFVDTTAAGQLQARLEEAGQELETAFEELQSTNEELETTNEELQSTIEELETTNEELQSTNEELETMNEELQSTNEELETINAELDLRTSELHGLNAYTNSILASVRMAVVVVDGGGAIRAWNRRAEDLWGLRAEEVVGQALQNLEIGLPVERLKGAVRAAVDGRSEAEEVVLEAVNRRGRSFTCRVTVAPFRSADPAVAGAVLVMEEQPPPVLPGGEGEHDVP